MSNKRKLRVPTYGQRARAEFPDYARPGAPCDVEGCGQLVTGDRTITLVAERRKDDVSVLVRLCAEHLDLPYAELLKLLPQLDEMIKAAGSPGHFGTKAADDN